MTAPHARPPPDSPEPDTNPFDKRAPPRPGSAVPAEALLVACALALALGLYFLLRQ